MISKRLQISLFAAIPFAILPSSTSAFVVGNNGRCPTALGAGGFGKESPANPSSSKKKKQSGKKRKKTTAVAPSYIPYDSNLLDGSPSSQQQNTRALLEWLDEEEVEGLDAVEIGFSKLSEGNAADDGDTQNLLRGVFAKQDIQPGEYIMAVPYVTTLLVDEDFDGTSDPSDVVLRADEPEVGFQFWKQFYNSNNNENNSNYQAFLNCIPLSPDDPNFDGTPDFWSEEEIRQLEIPGVIEKMLSRKDAITKISKRVVEGSDDCTESSALSTIQQCCWIIQSRAFTTYKKAIDLLGTKGLLSRVVLIPFIDMINHAPRKSTNAEMQVVETKEYDESFYALVATKPIPKGTEVRICYGTGEETSLELFCKYGFLPAVEDREKERAALGKLLEGVDWSTTLEEDQAMLETEEGKNEPLRTILSIRIYAKSLMN